MKKIPFVQAMTAFLLAAIAVGVIGGNINPANTPAPTMRTLDELYKNIQPGLPSDWLAYPKEIQSSGAGSIHMTIEGQFPIQGSCTAEGKEGTVVVVGLGHEITVPIDSSSGQATGRRMHNPVIIAKYIDKSSPLLYRALVEGRLMDLTLTFYRTDTRGQEEEYYSIILDDARVSSFRTAFPNIEQIGFVYRSIKWVYKRDGIQFEDDWQASPI